jgi:chromosome segregation ATPase
MDNILQSQMLGNAQLSESQFSFFINSGYNPLKKENNSNNKVKESNTSSFGIDSNEGREKTKTLSNLEKEMSNIDNQDNSNENNNQISNGMKNNNINNEDNIANQPAQKINFEKNNEINNAQPDINSLENDLKNKDALIIQLKNEKEQIIKKYEQKIKELTHKNSEDIDAIKSHMQTQSDSLKEEINKLNANNNELINFKKRIQKENDDLKKENTELKKEINDYKEQIKTNDNSKCKKLKEDIEVPTKMDENPLDKENNPKQKIKFIFKKFKSLLQQFNVENKLYLNFNFDEIKSENKKCLYFTFEEEEKIIKKFRDEYNIPEQYDDESIVLTFVEAKGIFEGAYFKLFLDY